jgi:phage baseplate assembly protein gpV
MSTLLFNSISRIARHEAHARAIAGIGVVTEAFGANGTPDYSVTVTMRDSGLVLPKVPIAVDATGFAALPDVNDLVVVLFTNGDLHSGVVVGRLYHPDLNPPKNAEKQIVMRLPAGSDEPKLNLEMAGDPAAVTLKIENDMAIECVKDRIEFKVGDMKVSLTTGGGGRAEIAAAGSTITLKADGDITIKSGANLTLESAGNMEIKASGTLALKGAKVDIN